MRRRIVRAVVTVALLSGTSLAVASSLGPQPARTGAFAVGPRPAEQNCTLCHQAPLNDPNGSVEILGIPTEYEPRRLYNFKVRLTYNWPEVPPTPPRWGFQLQAVSATTGDSAGIWVLGGAPPESLKVVRGVSTTAWRHRRYLEHTQADIHEGSLGPSQEWNVYWQAPDTDIGKVYFFAAGNAANGDQCHECGCAVSDCDSDVKQDHIFTTAESTMAGTAVIGVPGPIRVTSAVLDLPRPNPMSSGTDLGFTIPRAGAVDLSIHDPQGRRVRSLVRRDLEPGLYRSFWDGRLDDGTHAATGVYFVRLSAPGQVRPLMRKVVLAR
jgi:hypothetical protein